MPRYRLTPAALEDMREIARYSEAAWGKAQRNQYLAKIDARFDWLTEHTTLAHNRDDVKPGYLSYPQGEHVIFFRQTLPDSDLEILAILHRSMDVERHL